MDTETVTRCTSENSKNVLAFLVLCQIWGYRASRASNFLTSIKETLKQNLDDPDTLKVSMVSLTLFHVPLVSNLI